MDILRLAISKPVGVTVGVILVVMFGFIGLSEMPVQLTPNVDRPEITIETSWPGRSPQEIVDEIVKEQEEQLKNVSSLKTMRSTSNEGSATINLEFFLGTNVDRALQEVSDKLRQVPAYPDEVDEPTIEAADGSSENAIAWIIFDVQPDRIADHPDFDIATLFEPIEDEIKPYLERIDGIAEVNVFGGRDREVRILVDAKRLAQLSLTHIDVLEALRSENRNVSAGTIAEGKRDYRVRVLGQFRSDDEILDTIVDYRDGGPVYVRDVATVDIGFEKKRGFVRSLGEQSIAMNVIRQSGANVMSIMDELKVRLDVVRVDVLPKLHPTVGPDLRLRQVYDETIYISSAIDLVTQNLWVGGLIAAAVLLLFLRSLTSTGVIALAIPVSVVGTFLVMLAMGRSLNVISLAGLAFAVGMVVDNAIVVLENIDRHRKMGKDPMRAAYDGGKEVWGAILASTLTTVAVFIPVLTIQEEAGQLFRDISIAIVAAVTLSLLVSITVIPTACSRWLKPMKVSKGKRSRLRTLFGLLPLFASIGSGVGTAIHWCITGWRAYSVRPALIVGLTALSVLLAIGLRPPLDYLPAGNRNLVFGGMLIPPGISVDAMEGMANRIESELNPYARASAEDPSSYESLPKIRKAFAPPGAEPFEPLPIENYFIGSFGGGMFVGATSEIEQIVKPLEALLSGAMNSMPDTMGFAAQTSLFGRGVGGGNTINIEITGPELGRVVKAAEAIQGRMMATGEFGFGVRADPSNFNLQQQEYQVRVNRLGRELGLRPDTVGTTIRALFDGAFVGDYNTGADLIDINMLPTGGKLADSQSLADIPIQTPRGPIVPLDQLVDISSGLGPQSIQRIEELSAVTIIVQPSSDQPLDTTIANIRDNYVEPARANGLIDRTMRVRYEGTAAKLDEVRGALIGKVSEADAPVAGWQRAMGGASWVLVGLGVAGVVFAVVRFLKRPDARFVYGAIGGMLLMAILAGLMYGFAEMPQLATARLVWALLVTYLLMAALFESFVYPFVIMFAVPLAVVGGFVGLSIVHGITEANPIISTQQLDVLTMLGFIILIGVVVNNAILVVHQSLNLMRGTADVSADRQAEALAPKEAIAEAVRTRLRPVFMSTLTSVGGMLPLVLFPGSGSELYRGLGSVVIGGLVVSTVFTLILVPLVFSVTLDMTAGVKAMLGRQASVVPGSGSDGALAVGDAQAGLNGSAGSNGAAGAKRAAGDESRLKPKRSAEPVASVKEDADE